jgi:signal peptidase I
MGNDNPMQQTPINTPEDNRGATENTVDGTSILLENEESNQEDQETKKEGIKGIISTVAILIIAPLIALSLTAFVFQSYEVDGPSMETTLQNKDRLIVYKLPKTISRLTGRDYIPKRGDIIIFTLNEGDSTGTGQSRQLIKRVIALPGEEIALKDNAYTVYNKDNPNGFNPDKADYGKVITNTSGEIARFKIPENKIFVSGDNRPNSLDSRSFGPIPLEDVIGKLSLRVYPFNKGQKF